jgi:capsular polysaccharide transport system permease protein
VQVNSQARAVQEQIASERSRLAAPKGKTLNVVAERYEGLMLEAQFAQDVYRTALTALEQARMEATRTLKKVSVVQSPTKPEYALEPRRIYNIVVWVLGTLILTGILHLLITIVREHRD